MHVKALYTHPQAVILRINSFRGINEYEKMGLLLKICGMDVYLSNKNWLFRVFCTVNPS
mgnify:CR=1 FL=1